MSIKDMRRSNWPRVLRKDYVAKDFEINGLRGQISLSVLRELTGPLTVHYPFGDVRIADTDYSWLQVALKDQYVWATAMYDSHDRMVNLYFDITAGNCFDDPENPCFEDMYLDIVIAGKKMAVLDQDELDEALEKGEITKEAYDHAEKVCKELYAYLCANKAQVMEWCDRSFAEMKQLLKSGNQAMQYEKSCGAIVFTRINDEIRYIITLSTGGDYGFPKGHMEPGEDERTTALREIREEVDLRPAILDGFRMEDSYMLPNKPGVGKKVVYFLAEYADQEPKRQPEEVADIFLMSYKETLEKLSFETTRRMLKEADAFLNR